MKLKLVLEANENYILSIKVAKLKTKSIIEEFVPFAFFEGSMLGPSRSKGIFIVDLTSKIILRETLKYDFKIY